MEPSKEASYGRQLDQDCVLVDEVVAEITDPYVRFDRPVDLLTVLHYDGELFGTRSCLEGR